MTPFDPVALVVMLSAFYPLVTPAELARARRERPEYFAGGRLGGSKGDKLTLLDGRVFDLIQAAGGPIAGRRWIAIDVTNDAGAAPDPFALEDGPLVPLDEDFVVGVPATGDFEALLGDELAQLGASDDLLGAARTAAVEFAGAATVDDAYEREITPALVQHAAFRATLDGDELADVLEAAGDHGRIIDATEGDYDEDPPPDAAEPDPGDPPGKGDDGGPQPPQF